MVSPIGSQFQIPGDPGAMGSYLTPDALMAYCQTRLQGLDTQMQTAFAAQQQANDDSSLLSSLEQSITLPTDDQLNSKANTNGQLTIAYAKIHDAMAKLDPNSTAYKALDKILSSIGTMDPKNGLQVNPELVDGNGQISASNFKTTITDAIGNAQKDLNSGSELSMINLQSIMSQRQEAIQLATNLVQSLGDQCNKITENIGK